MIVPSDDMATFARLCERFIDHVAPESVLVIIRAAVRNRITEPFAEHKTFVASLYWYSQPIEGAILVQVAPESVLL